MKYIKEIPNNYCKASLFAWNEKFILKFEIGMYEQIYKVSEFDLINSEELETALNEDFLMKVMERFKDMSSDFRELLEDK